MRTSFQQQSPLSSKNTEEMESALHALPPLPYDHAALEPHIDTETMKTHHDVHHRTYVDKLNKFIVDKHLPLMSLESMMAEISRFPVGVRNNGGGHYNHSLFWELLTDHKEKRLISPQLETAISKHFGSLDKFKAEFEQKGLDQFGSGWVWLIRTSGDRLAITSTPNQDNPLMDVVKERGEPLLACDVWEHAYYLKYRAKRAEYLKNFWNVVNWSKVEELFSRKH